MLESIAVVVCIMEGGRRLLLGGGSPLSPKGVLLPLFPGRPLPRVWGESPCRGAVFLPVPLMAFKTYVLIVTRNLSA